jgi:hypothetical protein
MNYSAFEQAAVEASAGVREMDAEIERLAAKREVLRTLVHNLLAVLPMNTRAIPADAGYQAGATLHAPEPEEPSFASRLPESEPSSFRREGWPHAPAVEQPSFAASLPESEPSSPAKEEWSQAPANEQPALAATLPESEPSSPGKEEWTDAPAEEQSPFAVSMAKSETPSLRKEEWPAYSPGDQRRIRELLDYSPPAGA